MRDRESAATPVPLQGFTWNPERKPRLMLNRPVTKSCFVCACILEKAPMAAHTRGSKRVCGLGSAPRREHPNSKAMPSHSRDRLKALARRNPANLEALVRENQRIFLNPERVGDLRLPLSEQFSHYVTFRFEEAVDAEDEELYSDLETALETGRVQGLARGDECASDSDDDDAEDLPEVWRDHPCDGWAAALYAEARATMQPLGVRVALRSVQMEKVQAWLASQLPGSVAHLKRYMVLSPSDQSHADAAACAMEGLVEVAQQNLVRAAASGGGQKHKLGEDPQEALAVIDTNGRLMRRHSSSPTAEGAPAASAAAAAAAAATARHLLGALFPRLLLVAHFLSHMGDGVGLAAEAQERGVECAVAVAELLARDLCDVEEAAGLRDEVRCAMFPCAMLSQALDDPRPKQPSAISEIEMVALDEALGEDGVAASRKRTQRHAARILAICTELG